QRALGRDLFYEVLGSKGLKFGPIFCGLSALWQGENEALGRAFLLDSLAAEASAYDIHPVLLDACVQTLAAAVEIDEQVIFLPVHLERYRRELNAPFSELWSYARLRPRTGKETLSGDITVFDAEGRLVAQLEGLHLKRVDLATLAKGLEKKYTPWFYEIGWENRVLEIPASVPAGWSFPSDIANVVRPEIASLSQEQGWESYSDLEPQLDAVCTAYVAQALRKLGWQFQAGEKIPVAALPIRLQIKSQFHRLLDRLLEMLAEDGVLQRNKDNWEVLRLPEELDPELRVGELLGQYPRFEAELTFTRRCGRQLAEALVGDSDPLQLLFPGGDASTAEKLYRESPSACVYNGIAQRVVKAALEKLPADQRLRVLEIGGGTGSTSSYLLPKLPADRTDYLFTDISPLFTTRAADFFKQYGFVRTQPLDIEMDPALQGVSGTFDLIVAANVLHATRDLNRVFAHVRKLLSPGGLLLMLEVTQRQRWIDLTFGLTDGWWRFTDTELRPSHPLLTQEQWTKFLKQHGFRDPVMLPDVKRSSRALSLNTAILAQMTLESRESQTPEQNERQFHWLIFKGKSPLTLNPAQQFKGHGQSALTVQLGPIYQRLDHKNWQVNASNPDDFDRLLKEVIAEFSLGGILHLCGVGQRPAQEESLDAFREDEEQICASALHLVQAVLKAALSDLPRLWIVTRGGQSLDLQPTTPLQAMLWGFGKALSIEHPELNCTCVDLDPSDAMASLEPLLREMEFSDGEAQVAIRHGVRYVARLQPSLQTETKAMSLPIPTNSAYCLDIGERGVLDNLKLRATSRRPPGRGEVEVRVQATGLNFRDVLNAMDMYPGGSGPLGSECSGHVNAIGEGVEHLRVGDPVIAIAIGAFISHVTTSAELVVPMPAGMTFEEAVTIPNTFLTAYWALHHLGKMESEERVLIHAGAGGVGLAAVQLAQQAGAEIFATAGSPEKRDFLRSLGIKYVMNSRTLDFADEVLQLTGGRGVDLVLNSLSGEFIPKSLSLLASGGRFLEIGRTGIWSEAQVHATNPGVTYFPINLGENYMQTPGLIRKMLLALLDNFKSGGLKPLPFRVFPLTEAVSAFRFMAQGRHIGKIVLSQPWRVDRGDENTSLVQPDAIYWITGGLRGLGLKAAEWLVELGARHLVLMGRSAPSDSARKVLDRLNEKGARTRVVQGDVSKEEDVARIVEETNSGAALPLRGVIHCAGVLEDGEILQQNWDRYRRVLAPKVDGAWLLHRATKNMKLDFFVLYSSAASILGSAGQTNHSAANAFLDALAHYRQSQGLPAISINWGAWSEIGAAAARWSEEALRSQGITPISPVEGFEITNELIRRGSSQVGVLPVSWPQYLSYLPGNRRHFYRQLIDESQQTRQSKSTKSPESDFSGRLDSVPPNKRRGVLQAEIRDQAIKVLGLSPSQPIDMRFPLNGLGLDSLMAVELRNALGQAIGRSLPATMLFDYPTIEDLTDYLGVQLGIGPGERPQHLLDGPENVLDKIEQLSDEELDRLLSERMKNG
ncbi:MAG: SDR family oxidoreductase, partial [Terriglobia bacterium]